MARPARHRIELSEQERVVLERRAGAEKLPFQDVWIYRRDPEFAVQAGRALDLYARVFDGKRLRPDESVISADEKSQLQALGRRHETSAPGPGRRSRYEFEYKRRGMCITRTCSTVSSRRPGSTRSAGSSSRS